MKNGKIMKMKNRTDKKVLELSRSPTTAPFFGKLYARTTWIWQRQRKIPHPFTQVNNALARTRLRKSAFWKRFKN
jgi:hypothetical protein